MSTHRETFHDNRGCKLAIIFFYQFRCFQNKNLGWNFQSFFARNGGHAHPYFSYENEALRHWLSYYLRRMTTFLVLEVCLFHRVRFSEVQGPGQGSIVRQCRKRSAFSEISKTGCIHYNDGCFQAFQTGIPMVHFLVTFGSHLKLEKK